IDAALGKKREETAIDTDGGHAGKPVRRKDRRQANIAERWVVVALSGGMHAVHAEATGPKFGRSDGPVVLPTSVLHIGAKDHTIAFGAKLAVANDGGYGVAVMIAAVAS